MKPAAPPPKMGVACPACGAVVVVSPALRWKKMQCPKCRAVTALPSPKAEGPIPEESPQGEVASKPPMERSEATRFEARLSTLEARVALLEKELHFRDRKAEGGAFRQAQGPERVEGDRKEARAEREPHGVLSQEPSGMVQADLTVRGQTERGFAPVKTYGRYSQIAELLGEAEKSEAARGKSPNGGDLMPAFALGGERFKAPPEDLMLEKLAEITAGEVAIRVKEGDTEAILFGEWLGLVFIKAGWSVPTFETRRFSPEDQSLTLSVSGNFPIPKRASTIHSALAAAGLGLAFGIDPTSDSPIPTLIVPRRPVEKRDPTEAVAEGNPPRIELGGDSPGSNSAPGDS